MTVCRRGFDIGLLMVILKDIAIQKPYSKVNNARYSKNQVKKVDRIY